MVIPPRAQTVPNSFTGLSRTGTDGNSRLRHFITFWSNHIAAWFKLLKFVVRRNVDVTFLPQLSVTRWFYAERQ